MENRPTIKELDSKLRAARAYLKDQDGRFVDSIKATADFIELGISSAKEIWPLIRIALDEIKAKDYAGIRPPAVSYEKPIYGCESWAFRWESKYFGKVMYLRFFIPKTGVYFHSSLHESRPEKKQ